jgi:uncharacterized protein with PIN domain
MGYWDTSALVKLYAKEPDSTIFEAQAMRTAAGVVASRIALYEARAAFQRKEAESILQSVAAQKLYSELLQDVAAGEVRVVELGSDVEREYGQVLTLCYQQNPRIPLRTLDALSTHSRRTAFGLGTRVGRNRVHGD